MKFEPSMPRANTQRSLDFFRAAQALQARDYGPLYEQSKLINESVFKRTLDIGVSAGLLLFFLPAFVVIAAAVRISSPGPILFRQERYGAGQRVFRIFKFRTMRVSEGQGAFSQASRNDARLTPIGGFLRKSSLDELPQLFNVLEGSMSLVGPRPHAVPMDDYYREFIPQYSARHLVRPGLTGLAQINGYRGPTDDIEAIAGRVALDVAYIREWSPMTEFKVLLRTPAALFGSNAF